MIHEGQIVLFQFPHSDQVAGKLRPALVIRKLPGFHDDWLVCMISSQLTKQDPEFDEVINEDDSDYLLSGLKRSSIIRVTKLAVVNKRILLGSIGEIEIRRLTAIRRKLAAWIIGS
jgi:mRNA interferase MazF